MVLIHAFILTFAIATLGFVSTLRVVATTPDLGALAREIGGDDIKLTVLARPGDDPHFLDAKTSVIRILSKADVFIVTGMDLEAGWAPLLLRGARNNRVMPRHPGYIDASIVIQPMGIPTGSLDRSHGDVHAAGNPHFLLDPRAGRAVASLLRDRFSALRPERAADFDRRHADFLRRLDEAEARWDKRIARHRGAKVVGDHELWFYFMDRFGFEAVGYLEPKPGVPPTTRHLKRMIETMTREGVRVIIASPYFDERHANFVARNANAKIVRLAHQPGSRPGSENYIGMMNIMWKHSRPRLRSCVDRASPALNSRCCSRI